MHFNYFKPRNIPMKHISFERLNKTLKKTNQFQTNVLTVDLIMYY